MTTLPIYEKFIQDQYGNILPGASVTVIDESTSTLAVLKPNRDGTGTLGNPVTADVNGFVSFFVAVGTYRITYTSGSFTRTLRYVVVANATVTTDDLTFTQGYATVPNEPRTVTDELRESVKLTQFHFVLDVDWTNAFVRALDYCSLQFLDLELPSLAGGQAYSVSGLCHSGSSVPATVRIFGHSKWNTTIESTTATANLFVVGTGGVTFDELRIQQAVATPRTAGAFIRQIAGAHDLTVRNMSVMGAFTFLYVAGGEAPLVQWITLSDTVASSGATATDSADFVLSGGGARFWYVLANNDAGARPFTHLRVTDAAACYLFGCDLISAKHNVYFNPGNGQSALTFWATSSLFDTPGVNGVTYRPTGTGVCLSHQYVGGWASNAAAWGFDFETAGSALIDGISIVENDILTNISGGVRAKGNIKNLRLHGNKIAACGTAVYFEDVVSGDLDGNLVGPTGNNAGNTLGLWLNGTTQNVKVRGGSLAGNTTNVTLTTSGTGNYIADDIPGYEPTASPAQVTSDQNDYAPTLLVRARIYIFSDAARTITGIAGGVLGARRIFQNVGSFAILFQTQSSASTAANRLDMPGHMSLEPGGTFSVYWDPSISRWKADAQAPSANLSSEARLVGAADKISYYTGVGAKALTDFTSTGRSLMDDTSTGAMRTTLGLGTAAVKDTGTSGNTIPLLDGNNQASGTWDFSNTTDATSTTAAAVKTGGGLGVAKKIRGGTDLHIAGNTLLGGSVLAYPLAVKTATDKELITRSDVITGGGGVLQIGLTSNEGGLVDIAWWATKFIFYSGTLSYGTSTASTLAKGFYETPYSNGIVSTGTLTPDAANGNKQYYTNGGGHTLAPPAAASTIEMEITNNGSAVIPTTSGFTAVKGDAFTTTSGHKFICVITKTQTYSLMVVQALQ